MRYRTSLFGIGFSFIVVGSVLAPAAAAEDIEACRNGTGDKAIAACTRAIKSGRWRGHDLANVYYYRGVDYARKGDKDHASADYATALHLIPANDALSKEIASKIAALQPAPAADPVAPAPVAPPPVADDATTCANFASAADVRIAACTNAIKSGPEGRDLAKIYFARGRIYFDARDYDNALADLAETIRLEPDGTEAYIDRAAIFYVKGDLDRALADIEEMKRLKPDDADPYSFLGLIYYAKGDNDRAIADFDEAIRLHPNDAGSHTLRGLAYLGKGDKDRALADYDEAIRLDSGFAKAYLNRGDFYSDKGDKERAIADYQAALPLIRANDPVNDILKVNPDEIAGKIAALQNPATAPAIPSKAPPMAPASNPLLADDANICSIGAGDQRIAACSNEIKSGRWQGYSLAMKYLNRGDVYFATGDKDRALADCDEAIRLDPKIAKAYLARGIVQAARGDQDRALADFGEAVRLDPKFAAAFYGRGDVYSSKGDKDRALADYDEAIRLDPNYVLAYIARAGAYDDNGDKERALADYQLALGLIKADDPAKELMAAEIAALRATPVADADDVNKCANGAGDERIAACTNLIKSSGWRGGALAILFIDRGAAYYGKGEKERALADFDAAIRFDPKSAYAFNGRGDIYRDNGDKDHALADYQAASRLTPTNYALNREVAAKIGALQAAPPRQPDALTQPRVTDVARAPSPTQATASPQAPPPIVVPVAPPPIAPAAIAAAPTPTAAAGRRLALVIGNADYKNAVLANPTFDADLVSASLRKVGFEVTEVKDADFDALDAAVTSFVKMEDRPDVVLFYFAGHGFALPDGLRQRNYLMSTSARLNSTSEAALRRDGIPLDELIDRISAPAKITLAFVDACRNDPFHRGAGDRGFERVEVPLQRQLYIGMSTKLGRTAIDGDEGKGSPFAQAFVQIMTTPGLRIDDAFRKLREEVARRTDDKQKPEILQDDLKEGAFVLVGEK